MSEGVLKYIWFQDKSAEVKDKYAKDICDITLLPIGSNK